MAFTVLRLGGAAYLLYLGVRALRQRSARQPAGTLAARRASQPGATPTCAARSTNLVEPQVGHVRGRAAAAVR